MNHKNPSNAVGDVGGPTPLDAMFCLNRDRLRGRRERSGVVVVLSHKHFEQKSEGSFAESVVSREGVVVR